jgi:hypothetical protein
MQYRLHCEKKDIDKYAGLLGGERVLGVILVQVNSVADLEKMADKLDRGIIMSNRTHDLWVETHNLYHY